MSDKAILEEIKKLDSRLDSIDITLAKQHVSLDEHIRRTELLENKVDPIEKHVVFVNAAFKILSAVGAIILGLAALYESYKS